MRHALILAIAAFTLLAANLPAQAQQYDQIIVDASSKAGKIVSLKIVDDRMVVGTATTDGVVLSDTVDMEKAQEYYLGHLVHLPPDSTDAAIFFDYTALMDAPVYKRPSKTSGRVAQSDKVEVGHNIGYGQEAEDLSLSISGREDGVVVIFKLVRLGNEKVKIIIIAGQGLDATLVKHFAQTCLLYIQKHGEAVYDALLADAEKLHDQMATAKLKAADKPVGNVRRK